MQIGGARDGSEFDTSLLEVPSIAGAVSRGDKGGHEAVFSACFDDHFGELGQIAPVLVLNLESFLFSFSSRHAVEPAMLVGGQTIRIEGGDHLFDERLRLFPREFACHPLHHFDHFGDGIATASNEVQKIPLATREGITRARSGGRRNFPGPRPTERVRDSFPSPKHGRLTFVCSLQGYRGLSAASFFTPRGP